MSKRFFRLIILGILLVVIILIGIKYSNLMHSRIDIDVIKGLVQTFGSYGEIVYVLIISVRPFLFLPSPAVFIIGGVIFGTIKGSIFNLIGILANATICYYLAGRFKGVFHRFIGEKYLSSLKNVGRNEEIKTLFTMRVTPAFPFDPVSYASGLVGIPYKKFIIGTALGSTPKVILYTFLGNGIENLFSLRTILVYGVLIALAISPYVFYKFKNNNTVV